MTRSVKAYHGTTHSVALAIVDRSAPFDLSVGEGDWLGRGAYFFVNAGVIGSQHAGGTGSH